MALPETAAWLHAAFLVVLAVAALTDLRWLRIPNPLVLTALAVALLTLAVEPVAVGRHLLAGAVVFAITLPLFAGNLLGGGDAKLFPAIGVWLGPATLEFFVVTSLLAGALALVLLLLRWALGRTAAAQERLWPALRQGGGVPLAVPAFAAAWFFV